MIKKFYDYRRVGWLVIELFDDIKRITSKVRLVWYNVHVMMS